MDRLLLLVGPNPYLRIQSMKEKRKTDYQTFWAQSILKDPIAGVYCCSKTSPSQIELTERRAVSVWEHTARSGVEEGKTKTMDEEKSVSNVETSKAERSVWLMKCPVVVAKSWQNHHPSPSQPLSKVVLSLDPLLPEDDPSHLQVSLFLLHSKLLPSC